MKIPSFIKNTKAIKNIRDYMDTEFSEVLHTTLNPEGPGVVRIHLIPPKAEDGFFHESVAIINGSDIIPINFFWAVMLAELLKQINVYDGKEISLNEAKKIIDKTADRISDMVRFIVLPVVRRDKIIDDLWTMYETFTQIAYGQPVTADIKMLSIGEYSEKMRAPHRMDVMVSAMTKDGNWHCNQKCIHCYAAGQKHAEEAELSTFEWKAILDKCREAGIPQITFTGGEPTMRDDLFELISYARWFITRLNTNGIKLTPEYCMSLRGAEVDSVQITFYSSDAEVHNKLVGADQFENTARGIDNAINAGLSLSINTPLCKLNKDYISTLKYLHEKGIIYVTCSGLITTGAAATAASEELQLTSEELLEILKEAVKYCNENGMELAFTSPGWIDKKVFEDLGISTPTCGACLSNMAITPGGNVVPCQSWLSEKPLGNMLTDSWETIWESDTCKNYRSFASEMSGRCPLRRYCR